MALSLRTDTILRMNIGTALVRALQDAGCSVTPLAPLALHEVLINAAIHGNLAVETGLATTWTDLEARQDLVASALKHEGRQKLLVTVALGWDALCATAVIADEGCGYTIGAPEHQQTTRRRGAGRGLIIARAAAQIDVFQGGRSTRLTFSRHDLEAC